MSDETMHTLAGPSQFPNIRWTLAVAAGDPRRKEARSALVSLCENYWYPLDAYLRRRGYPADQAQDLTQEFLTRVLEGRYLDRADPEKGRPSFNALQNDGSASSPVPFFIFDLLVLPGRDVRGDQLTSSGETKGCAGRSHGQALAEHEA
jgi:hypothetical protein